MNPKPRPTMWQGVNLAPAPIWRLAPNNRQFGSIGVRPGLGRARLGFYAAPRPGLSLAPAPIWRLAPNNRQFGSIGVRPGLGRARLGFYAAPRPGLSLAPPPPYRLIEIPENAEGIRETLKHMREQVDEGKLMPGLRKLAIQIVKAARVPGRDWLGELAALFQWCRANVRYTLDTNDLEVIQRADQTIETGAGDCDDFVILLLTLAEHVGFAGTFCALGFGPIGEYTHVIAFAEIPGELPPIAADCTEPQPLGWFPPGATCAMLCPLSPGSSFATWAGTQDGFDY